MERNIRAHNREAWDRQVELGNPWTVPVTSAEIAAARQGTWQIYLTESRPVPRDWFPSLEGADVLCLASGGGQQGPILSAAGARVIVYDNSPAQLRQDQMVAEREGLALETMEGDMRDLGVFTAEQFDLIVHPVSNIFVPEILPVWKECYRVLRPGGVLMTGILNPLEYIFDHALLDDQGVFEVRYPLPYSDASSIDEAERVKRFGQHAPIEYSHTLEEQIGGQMQAGLVLTALYESARAEGRVADFFPSYIATRAVKPPLNSGSAQP